jgi:hypothetical protein
MFRSVVHALVMATAAVALFSQVYAGCFRTQFAPCSECAMASLPFTGTIWPNCDQNPCGCSGNPTQPAGPNNPSFCGCQAAVEMLHGTVAKGVNCTPGGHAGCRDDWTIKTKIVNGEVVPDDVACARYRACAENCVAQNQVINGTPIFVRNHCENDPNSNWITFRCNQVELVGDPC